jgi:hypothetical protein
MLGQEVGCFCPSAASAAASEDNDVVHVPERRQRERAGAIPAVPAPLSACQTAAVNKPQTRMGEGRTRRATHPGSLDLPDGEAPAMRGEAPAPSAMETLGREFAERLLEHTTAAVESTRTALERAGAPHREDGEEDSPSKPWSPEMTLEARCSWCGEVCMHSILSVRPEMDGQSAQLLQRKQEYVCGGCDKQTCPCDKRATCNGMARRLALWDDALCKTCDDLERAEAQAFFGMMSQIVDGFKDGSGNVLIGVVDHSKGIVEGSGKVIGGVVDGSGKVIGGVVDGVVDHSKGLVDDVKGQTEHMADKSQFKGMLEKMNKDFSILGESGKDFVGNVASAAGGAVGGAVEGVVPWTPRGTGREVEQAAAEDEDGSGKYLQLMFGHIKGMDPLHQNRSLLTVE